MVLRVFFFRLFLVGFIGICTSAFAESSRVDSLPGTPQAVVSTNASLYGSVPAVSGRDIPAAPSAAVSVEELRQAAHAVEESVRSESVQRQPIRVVGPSRRLSFEALRRAVYLYPDHDLTSRFVELSTERAPLFGEDKL